METIDLDTIILRHGCHARRTDGVCALEAAAWLAGERHGDAPSCVAPTIRRFMIRLNDSMSDDEQRTRILRPVLRDILGTATTPADEIARGYIAADFAARCAAPAWLDRAGKSDRAAALRAMAPIADRTTARAARDRLRAAAAAAYAAYDAYAADADAADAADAAAYAAYDAYAADARREVLDALAEDIQRAIRTMAAVGREVTQ